MRAGNKVCLFPTEDGAHVVPILHASVVLIFAASCNRAYWQVRYFLKATDQYNTPFSAVNDVLFALSFLTVRYDDACVEMQHHTTGSRLAARPAAVGAVGGGIAMKTARSRRQIFAVLLANGTHSLLADWCWVLPSSTSPSKSGAFTGLFSPAPSGCTSSAPYGGHKSC